MVFLLFILIVCTLQEKISLFNESKLDWSNAFNICDNGLSINYLFFGLSLNGILFTRFHCMSPVNHFQLEQFCFVKHSKKSQWCLLNSYLHWVTLFTIQVTWFQHWTCYPNEFVRNINGILEFEGILTMLWCSQELNEFVKL